MTKQKARLENWLKKIDWKLRECGCEHYVIENHNGIETGWVLFGDGLTRDCPSKFEQDSEHWCVFAQLNNCAIKLVDKSSLSISEKGKNPQFFVLFMNHTKKSYTNKEEEK